MGGRVTLEDTMGPAPQTDPRTTILVVDDDPDICQALQDLIEHEGFSVTTVNTGGEALIHVGRGAFGAVLLDIGLPDRDGLNVLTEIHRLHSELPVIILTAFTTPDRTVGALDRGAFAYLTKPYRRDELLATLRRAVGVQALTVKAGAMEQALTMSEARFTVLVANIPGAVYRCACDPQWMMAFLSDGIADLCGYPAKDFIHNAVRTYASIIHPDDRPMVERAVFDAVGRQEPYALEYRITHADGSVGWVMERGRGAFGADGAVTWLEGVILDITERKQAEATLRQTEERLELAVEGSSDGLWDVRLLKEERWWSPHTPVWWSPRFKALLGFHNEEFPNVLESWTARLHPDDKERIFQALTAHIDRRIPYDVEYRLRTKRGEYRWYRARGQAIWEPDGHMVRMAGSLQDIHDRIQAQAALKASEGRYRALYDDQPSMFFTINAAGTVLSVNQFGAEHLGYTVEELIGTPVLNVFDPDDRAAVGRALTRCFELPAQEHIWEFRKRRKDGSQLWVRETIRVVPDPQQEAIALIVCEDITERKRAEEAGRRSQALSSAILSAILDHLPHMVFVKDAKDLRFVHFNKAGEDLRGYPREEMIGKCDADLFPPEEAAFFTAKDREALKSGGVVEIPEEPIQTRHKGLRWLHTKKIAIRADDGAPLYLLGISEDITERRGGGSGNV